VPLKRRLKNGPLEFYQEERGNSSFCNIEDRIGVKAAVREKYSPACSTDYHRAHFSF
jgi:hypothetical protein